MSFVDVRESCDSHVAPLLAARLVSQVLDEAFVIARAADESGQPWRYVSMLRNLRRGRLSDTDEITFIASKGDSTLNENNVEEAVNVVAEITFIASKGDSTLNENNVEEAVNVVATSTPQKVDDVIKLKSEHVLIGQGDEEYNMQQTELSKSTSMFINHLFDMSEVERVVICDDTQVVHDAPADNLLTQAMMNIMETYVNSAFATALDTEPHPQLTCPSKIEDQIVETSKEMEKSALNFLADVLQSDVAGDVAFCIEDDADADNNNSIVVIDDEYAEITCAQVTEIPSKVDGMAASVKDTEVETNGDNFYENAYLTLNRDYDQCSEDDLEQILEDPKGLPMQEVQLKPANTSDEEVSEIEQNKEARQGLAAVSGVSGVSGKSKSSLMSRCRSQTAKLLSCLRGFWRRKTPGRRKKKRPQKLNRNLCPLSPSARRRASSVLDQIDLYSPLPSRSVTWKYNTVNEALVHSSRWKEYEFDNQPIEKEEH